MSRQRTGEQILEESLLATHSELAPGAPAFDPAALVAIITAIFELFRGCSSPARAKEQIRRGGAIAKTSLRQILRDKGYRGRDLWQTATRLAEKGAALSEADIDALLKDAADVPTPPPQSSWWTSHNLSIATLAMASLLAGMTCSHTAQAADWWPADPVVTHDVNFWPEFQPPAVVAPQPPAKPKFPQVQRWEFFGDTGPESLRRHLMEADHRTYAMNYLGIKSTADYQDKLRRLDHGELKQLHSIAHEIQEGRRVAPLASQRKSIPRPPEQTRVLQVGGCPGGNCPSRPLQSQGWLFSRR